VAERSDIATLLRRAEHRAAVPMTPRDDDEPLYVADEPAVESELIEPGHSLALADLAPPSVSAGDRLVRLAYRMGVPGGVLRAPFRKPSKTRLLATVTNPLPGWPTAGTALRAGFLMVHGGKLPLGEIDFASRSLPPPFERAIHGFRWLDDLEACAPREAAAPIAENILALWLEANRQPAKGPAWTVGNTGHRLMAWLIHAPLLLSGPDKAFRARVLAAVADTARWLDRHVGRTLGGSEGEDRLAEVTGWAAVVAAGLLLSDGKPRRLYGEAGLLDALGELVGDDGGVLSRSPLAQIEAISALVRLSACYRATRRDPPESIATMLAILVPPLLALLHDDGGLASFQGAGATEASDIETLVAATGVRARPLRDARQWGYQRVAAGPPGRATVLIVDAAPPPLARHARDGCASTLAFEFSSAGQRVIVNCGGAAFAGGALPLRLGQGLRATAAHSTLVLDDNNSTAVLTNGRLGAGVAEVEVDRRIVTGEDDAPGATRIEGSHDGYAARFGMTHRRILTLRDDGGELRGEDRLVPVGRRARRGRVGLAIRFHLAPWVAAYLFEDGQGATLALPDGQGRPQAARQIVIQGPVLRGGGTFPWVLERVG
jgi:uncharacterized heparinase superfamily protein